MKLSGKITATILCTALIASVTGCGGSGGGRTSTADNGGAAQTQAAQTEAATTTTTEDDDVVNPVDMAEYVDEDAGTLENPNLMYLGYYDMRTAADVKPSVKLFEETYGGTIDYTQCTWGEHSEKLQVMIASGDSPDLVDIPNDSFLVMMSKNVYEDLTDKIDLSKPQWDGMDSLVEQYSWKGKHFYYPWHASAMTEYIYYSKARFEEFGMTTPKELYESGEWDWNTFRETMMKFIDSSGTDSEVYGVYGQTLSSALICTTGTPLVSLEDGVVTNNMKTTAVDRAANFLEGLRRDGLAVTKDGYWGNEVNPVVLGSACFLSNGQYHLETFREKYPEADVEFVPFPKDPDAGEYYMKSNEFGYLVPKGSKNVDGAATFIDLCRLCKTDPGLRKEVDESNMRGKGWTQEDVDFIAQFENLGDYNVVADFYGSLDSETSKLLSEILINTTFFPDQDSWTVQRDANINTIDVAIQNLNDAAAN